MKRTVATLTLCSFMTVVAGTSFGGSDRRLPQSPVTVADYSRAEPTVLLVSAADLPDQLDITSFGAVVVVGGAVLLGAALAWAVSEFLHHHGTIQEQPLAERIISDRADVLFDAPVAR